MSDICSVKLEFLRPGPAHNQLLSPLTPYVAVCGDDGSVTVNMPFEHRELLIRLGLQQSGSCRSEAATRPKRPRAGASASS